MFRNVTMFRFPAESKGFGNHLAESLENLLLRPVGPLEFTTHGFVPPMEGGPLVERVPGVGDLICLGVEERVLPPVAVKKVVDERVKEHEQRTGRKPGAKLRREIKDNVLGELLPKSLVRPSRVLASIDYERSAIFVDTSSRRRAELVIGALRKVLESLRVHDVDTERSVEQTLTSWLHDGDLPAEEDFGMNLDLGSDAVLYDPADYSRKATFKRMEPICCNEVQSHLDGGMLCSELEMILDVNRASFVLRGDLTIRRFKLLDGAMDDHRDQTFEDATAEFRGLYTLTHLTIRSLFDVLNKAFDFAEVKP